MINQETIIALATPTGLGAISVIRISGLNAISITEKLFKFYGATNCQLTNIEQKKIQWVNFKFPVMHITEQTL